MYAQSIIAFFLMIVIGIGSMYANKVQTSQEVTDSQLAGQHLSAYASFVSTYAHANAGVTGSVADAQVAAPTWFLRAGTEQNFVTGGKAYVFMAPGSQAKGFAIARVVGSPNAGLKIAGQLVPPGKTPGQTLPATIPDGSVVVVQ